MLPAGAGVAATCSCCVAVPDVFKGLLAGGSIAGEVKLNLGTGVPLVSPAVALAPPDLLLPGAATRAAVAAAASDEAASLALLLPGLPAALPAASAGAAASAAQ